MVAYKLPSVKDFFQRGGGVKGDGLVRGDCHHFSGFRVADFFGGAVDGVEGTEVDEVDTLAGR